MAKKLSEISFAYSSGQPFCCQNWQWIGNEKTRVSGYNGGFVLRYLAFRCLADPHSITSRPLGEKLNPSVAPAVSKHPVRPDFLPSAEVQSPCCGNGEAGSDKSKTHPAGGAKAVCRQYLDEVTAGFAATNWSGKPSAVNSGRRKSSASLN